MSVEQFLNKRSTKRERYHQISSSQESFRRRGTYNGSISAGETAAIGTSAFLLPHQLGREEDLRNFQEWQSDFDEGYRELQKRISRRRDRHQERYQEQIQEHFGPEISEEDLARKTLRENPETDTKIETARDVGPEAKLEYWQYFAREGGPVAQEELEFVGSDEERHTLSDEQFETLKQEDVTITDLGPFERHHVRPVYSSLDEDPTSIAPLTDPGNIRIMTEEAHRKVHKEDLTYGEAGQQGDLDTVQRDYEAILETKFEQMVEEAAEDRAGELGIAHGLVAGSVSAIVRYQKMRDKPQKRRALAATSALATQGLRYGAIGYAGFRTRDETSQLIADGTFDAAQTGVEVGADLTTDLIASGVGIEVAAAIRSAMQFGRSFRQGHSATAAAKRFGKDVAQVGRQEVAFVLGGIAADAATPIPEPQIYATVTATRVTYRLMKTGYNYRQNVVSGRECRKKRLSTLREKALRGV